MPKKSNYKGSFRSIIDMSNHIGKDGKIKKEIQVLPHGEFMTMPYGPLVINEEVFKQMVANFQAGVRKAVPVDVNHDGGKASGWIEKLINKGKKGLWATVDWTRYGKDLLSNKEYRLFSPEWSFDFVDPQHSTHHGAVLVAGSLTNRPLFKDMDFIKASDGKVLKAKDLTNSFPVVIIVGSDTKDHSKSVMKIKDILKKLVKDRTEEEVKFLQENSEDFSDEQKKQVADEKKEAKKAKDKEAKEKAEKEAKEKEAADKAKAKKAQEKKDGKKEVTMKASEVAELKKAQVELQTIKAKEAIEKEIKPLIANEKGGKILPKAKEAVIDLLLTCSDEQKEKFMSIMESMPELKIAGQISDPDPKDLTAQEKIEKLVLKAMKADKKLDKAEAYKLVLKASENQALIKEYNKELKAK